MQKFLKIIWVFAFFPERYKNDIAIEKRYDDFCCTKMKYNSFLRFSLTEIGNFTWPNLGILSKYLLVININNYINP